MALLAARNYVLKRETAKNGIEPGSLLSKLRVYGSEEVKLNMQSMENVFLLFLINKPKYLPLYNLSKLLICLPAYQPRTCTK